MIRTGKPIGYCWTHKSVFQETKKYWDIRFEGCTPPDAEILVSASDDEFTPSERAKKRRRVEKLAHDFLDGKVLDIHAARPDPAALKAIPARYGRETGTSVLLTGGFLRSRPEGERSWEDVDDDWEVLRKANARRKRTKKQIRKAPALDRQPNGRTSVTVEVEAASSKCSPQVDKATRRTRVAQLLPGPSEEALRQAAELRARKIQRDASEQPEIRDSLKILPTMLDSGPLEQTNPIRISSKPQTAASQSTPWLSRAASLETFAASFEDDGIQHEPLCSNVDTPSRRSRPVTRPARKARREGSSDTALDGAPAVLRHTLSSDVVIRHEDADRTDCSQPVGQCNLRNDANENHTDTEDGVENVGVSAKASYCTAPEDSVLALDDVSTGVTRESQEEDSQTRLLRRQGIRAAPRKAWASMNETSADDPTAELQPEESEAIEAPSVAADLRASQQESAAKAGTTQRGKRTKSDRDTGPYVARRSSHGNAVLTESQDAVDEHLPVDQQRRMGAFRVQLHTAAEATEKGTPFIFRKRGKVPKGGDADPPTLAVKKVKKTPRRVTFPSSESGAPLPAPLTAPRTEPVAAVPPVPDMSFGNDSSFPLKLNMALVDEHLNKALPVEAESAGRSSSVKKAIRREMKSSGAEITRMDGDLASSQVEPNIARKPTSPKKPRAENSGLADSSNNRPSAPLQWAGTQVLLQKAQRELFISPEKTMLSGNEEPTENTCNEELHVDTAKGAILMGHSREPLKQLSQEPLPSTQACMETWSPWSTVKKPEFFKRGVELPPQCIADRSPFDHTIWPDKRAESGRDTVGGHDDAGLRRSSLRFSMTTTDDSISSIPTPVPQTRKSTMRRSNPKRSSLGSAPDILPLEDSGPSFSSTKASTSTTATLPSFQAAQLLRDDSNPDRTLTELAHDLLDTNDISGILSQSR